MSIQLTVRNFILIIALFLGLINTVLFILREFFPYIWWTGDQQFYTGTSFSTHLESLLFFLFYLLIITILSVCILPNKNEVYIKKRNIPFSFIIISLLLFFYSLASLFYGVGVAAASENTAGSWQVLFYLISIDALYFAYALIERNSKRLMIASVLYSLSNVFRGWASFIILLVLIYVIRNRVKLEVKKIIYISILIIPLISVSLYVREFFRGGTGIIEIYNLQGLTGLDFYVQLLNHLLAKIIVRFDFYSHYIGISTLVNTDIMCYPYQENLFYKIILRTELAKECISLGSMLPSHLAEWYINKKSSFTVSSGFFALALESSGVFFISNIFIYFISTFIVKLFFNKYEIKMFFIYLIFLLFLQGWNYQFSFNYLSFIVGIFLINIFRNVLTNNATLKRSI